MEVISLWHCWGGMEAQVSLTVAFSSSAFFGLLLLIFLLTILHRFSMRFRSGEFAGQLSTPTPWSFNQRLVLLAVWAGAKSWWKMNSVSLKSWSAEGSMKWSDPKCIGCSDIGFQKNTMDQHQQMTLHPKSSQTVETCSCALVLCYFYIILFLFFCTVDWADLIRLHFTSDYTLYNLLCDK